MDRVEKAREVMQRAENLGFKLECDFGFMRVVKPISADPERREAIIAELGKYLPEIRSLVERRSTADRAKDFFGQRVVFLDENNLSPVGQSVLSGVLTSASGNGLVDVSITEGLEMPRRITSKAESLLIVLDEEKADASSSPRNDEPKPAKPGRRIFGFSARSSREE